MSPAQSLCPCLPVNSPEMNSTLANATNSCLDSHTTDAFRVSNGAFAALGCIPSVVSIVITLTTKKYKHCFKRFVLYLSIVCLLASVVGGIQVADFSSQPTERDACQAFGFVANYLAYCKSCLTLLICIAVFAFGRYHRQLQNWRFEAVIVTLATLFVPAMLSWEFVSLPDTTWCVVRNNLQRCPLPVLPTPNRGLGIGLAAAPQVALYALSAAMVSCVVSLTCRRAIGVPVLRQPSYSNLLSLCPMLFHSALLCLDYTGDLIIRVVVNDTNTAQYMSAISVVAFFYHFSNVFVPMMLFYDQCELLSSTEGDWRARGSSNNGRCESFDSTYSGRSNLFADHQDAEAINSLGERSLLCKQSKASLAI